jgi:16S rRNA (adenine1518-N6/adenine1519-N6)-dimethyltransferase
LPPDLHRAPKRDAFVRHVPRKRFGQHFLIDPSVIVALVAAIRPRRDDRMVEIGPGLGALTRPLLEHVDHLHVVEIDRDLVARLEATVSRERLTVHQCDALDFDFAALGPALRVVGNLPYNISTPLLFRVAESVHHICDAHFMLQHEVVERMIALPGNRDYGRLSVMLQYHFAMERVLSVPAAAFRPAPKVRSSVVRLAPLRREARERCDENLLREVVTKAFTQRRKTMRNSLHDYLGEDEFEALGIDPSARAETLSVEEFVRVTNHLAPRR